MTEFEKQLERERQKYFEAVGAPGPEVIIEELFGAKPADVVEQKVEQKTDIPVKGNALLLLIAAAIRPTNTFMQQYELMGMNGRQGKAAVDDIESKGYAERSYPKKKAVRGGSHPGIISLLEPGIEVLRMLGIKPNLLIGRGSPIHNFYAVKFGEYMKRKYVEHEVYYDKRFNTPEGFKDVDVSGVNSAKQVWVGEVILTGSAPHNANELRRSSHIKEAVEVYGIFEDRNLLDNVDEELKKIDGDENLAKVRLIFVGDIYED